MSDEAQEVPFAERQAWKSGCEEGMRRGKQDAEARIVVWLRAKVPALKANAPHGADWADCWAGEIKRGVHRERK